MTEPKQHSLNDTESDDESGIYDRTLLSSFPPPVMLAPRRRIDSARPPYRVVVAVDLSDLSRAVFAEGVCFARSHTPAELHVLTVATPVRRMLRLPHESALYTPKQLQERVAASLRAALGERQPDTDGVSDDVYVHVAKGDVAREILKLADDLLADLIVVGAHDRRGLAHRVSGSISRTVVSRASASVVLCRPPDFDHGNPVPALDPGSAGEERDLPGWSS